MDNVVKVPRDMLRLFKSSPGFFFVVGGSNTHIEFEIKSLDSSEFRNQKGVKFLSDELMNFTGQIRRTNQEVKGVMFDLGGTIEMIYFDQHSEGSYIIPKKVSFRD